MSARQTSFMAQCAGGGRPRRITLPASGLPRSRALTDSLGVFEMDVEVSDSLSYTITPHWLRM